MNFKQFLTKLPTDGWFIMDDTAIRRKSTDGYACCPIIAALAGDDTSVSNGHFDDVAVKHGMPRSVAMRIARAADGKSKDPLVRRIRRLLLIHCGLPETLA